MIVQCGSCATRFHVSDEKMRPGGIKIRCARCKHVFLALPPRPDEPPIQPTEPATPSDQPMAPAEPKLESEPQPEPSAPADEGLDDFSFVGAETFPEAQGEDDRAAREESTDPFAALFSTPWEEKPGGELEKASVAPFAQKDSAAGENWPAHADNESASELTDGLIPSTEPVNGAEEELTHAPLSDMAEEADFAGEEDDGISQEPKHAAFEEEELAAAELAPQPPQEMEFSWEPASSGFGDEAFEQDMEPEAGESGEYEEFTWSSSPGAQGREFGQAASPEPKGGDANAGGEDFGSFDWSPLDKDEVTEPATAARGRDVAADQEEQGETTAPQEPQEPVRVPAAPAQAVPVEPAPQPGATTPLESLTTPVAQAARSPMSRVLLVALLVLLALLAGVGYFLWKEGPQALDTLLMGSRQASPPAVGEQPAGFIEVGDITANYVQNPTEGELFVIRGRATNRYPQARSALQVKAVVLDGQGAPLMQQTVFCGNPLSDEEIASFSFARIEEAMNNQFGASLANLNVRAGQAMTFTIVFRNLPPEMAQFSVEAADSRPVEQREGAQ